MSRIHFYLNPAFSWISNRGVSYTLLSVVSGALFVAMALGSFFVMRGKKRLFRALCVGLLGTAVFSLIAVLALTIVVQHTGE